MAICSRYLLSFRFTSNPRLFSELPFRSFDTRRTMSTGSFQEAPGLLRVFTKNPKRLGRIQFLADLFKTNGFELRVAGGAVRDILRGKEPHDIDFATTARPEESLNIVRKHEDLLRIIVTTAGQRHGTVAVKFKEIESETKRVKLTAACKPEYDEESPYEITTLRCDKITDGRHAEVEFISDWRKDAERRDLTINAMFLSLDEGKLIDYFGGENDLNEGIVKFVGDADQRIKEDYLRILRYFRFWSRYSRGRKPDEETLAKLRANLDGLNQISGERIWQELKKTLSHLPCYEVVKLMLELHVFEYAGLEDEGLTDYDAYIKTVLDELNSVQENLQRYKGDILDKQLEVNPDDQRAKRLAELFPVIVFAATVQSDNLCLNAYKRVKFSNLERDTILYITQNRAKDLSINTFKYQLAMAHGPERAQLIQRIKAFLIFKGNFDIIAELESWEVPTFPVSGNVVAKAVKARRLPGHTNRDLLDSMKLEWAQSEYQLNADQLTESMVRKLDEISNQQTGDKPAANMEPK